MGRSCGSTPFHTAQVRTGRAGQNGVAEPAPVLEISEGPARWPRSPGERPGRRSRIGVDPRLDEGQAGHVRKHRLQLVRAGDPIETHSLTLHLWRSGAALRERADGRLGVDTQKAKAHPEVDRLAGRFQRKGGC